MARFQLRGNMAARWLTTAPANPAAPTQAELNAGVDLIGVSNGEALSVDVEGFEPSPSVVDAPDATSRQTGNIPGEVTYPTASMTFYKDDTTTTIKDGLVEGTSGFVVIMRQGQGSGNECDVWPAGVIDNSDMTDLSNVAHKFKVAFSTGVPTRNGTQAA